MQPDLVCPNCGCELLDITRIEDTETIYLCSNCKQKWGESALFEDDNDDLEDEQWIEE